MSKLCTQCGKLLLRDDSRFCNNCGASVFPAQPPSWMGKLEDMGNRASSRPFHASQRNAASSQVANPPSSPGRFSSTPAADLPLPQRELRVKVWEDAENTAILPPGEQQHGQLDEREPQFMPTTPEGNQVEDLPTTPVLSVVLPAQDQQAPVPLARQDQHVSQNGQTSPAESDDADLPTRPLPVNPPPANRAQPNQTNQPTARPFPAKSYRQTVSTQAPLGQIAQQQRQRQSFPVQVEPPQPSPVVQRPVTPALPISYPGFQQPAASVSPAVAVQAQPVRRKRSKARLWFVLALLLVMLVGGLTAWVIKYQPFSVAPVTKTAVSFQNTTLGFALQYPQGWTAQTDQQQQSVAFFDANHTDQVNVLRAATNGQSADQFVKKEAAQIGLTAQKNLPPLTFAGVSWQQVQGTVLLSGATYTETVLVTTRGNQLYTVEQIAPATTYTSADQLFFLPIRASFQLL